MTARIDKPKTPAQPSAKGHSRSGCLALAISAYLAAAYLVLRPSGDITSDTPR